MPRQLALLLCVTFILWLFLRDRKIRPMTSWGLWIPLLWIAIVGSRPVSYWFGAQIEIEEASQYLEGSPFDRNIFLLLIVLGTAVLFQRRVSWREIFVSNRWFFAFFLYCFLSIMWSDYPFVSFKRWTKELGNLIMILILVTEIDPVKATKAVLARYTYVAIPLSVVFIKYFPELGRYYNNYTWAAAFSGITTNKNALGSVLLLCGLYLAWDLIEMRKKDDQKKSGFPIMIDLALLMMVFWLLIIARSSTAMVCLALGTGTLFFMRFPIAKRQVRHLGAYTFAAGFLALVLFSFPDLIKAIVGMLGRDTTMTGRTELWSYLLKTPLNPLLGTGYQSFWLGARAEGIWEIFNFHPVQAHNGFLETYLNIGLIGLCLLLAVIVSTGGKLKKEMLADSSFGSFRFSFLFTAVLYNWTEAMFNGLNIVWIILLISVLSYPRPPILIPQPIVKGFQQPEFHS